VIEPDLAPTPNGWCAELWQEQLWEGATPLSPGANAVFRCGAPEEQRHWGCLPTPLLDAFEPFRECCTYVHPETRQRGESVRVGGRCGHGEFWECRDAEGSISHPDLVDQSPGLRDNWNERDGGEVLSDRVCDVVPLGRGERVDFACDDWLELPEALRE